jgi:hypothetical protein
MAWAKPILSPFMKKLALDPKPLLRNNLGIIWRGRNGVKSRKGTLGIVQVVL